MRSEDHQLPLSSALKSAHAGRGSLSETDRVRQSFADTCATIAEKLRAKQDEITQTTCARLCLADETTAGEDHAQVDRQAAIEATVDH